MRNTILLLTVGVLGVAGAAYAGTQFSSGASADSSDGTDYGGDYGNDTTDTTDSSATDTDMSGNRKAFLDMIAYSEGTAGRGDDGYNIIFGGGTFSSYADHPRIVVMSPYGATDAAGRYQMMAAVPGRIRTNTWDWVSRACGLTDFSPSSQDAAAIYLIKHHGALADVDAGRIETAIYKCRNEWASFAGSQLGQRTRTMSNQLAAFQSAGGYVA